MHELNVQGQAYQETEDTVVSFSERDITSSQLAVLQKLAVAKILYWAEIGRLIEHPRLLPILYAWKAWGDEGECTRYLIQVTQEDKGLLAFLCAAFQTPIDEALTKFEIIKF